MIDFVRLDAQLRPTTPQDRLGYAQLVKIIGQMREELATLRSGKKQLKLVLRVLQRLVEKEDGSEAKAIAFLREHGLVALEKKPEPPIDQKRKEFMEFWRKATPEKRKKLEEAVNASGDSVLLAEIEKEKA